MSRVSAMLTRMVPVFAAWGYASPIEFLEIPAYPQQQCKVPANSEHALPGVSE
jgi:hypothetical protein